MQTFLPYPDFARSAACLDYRRLGKQRVEAWQIYQALTRPDYGWQNHPAVKMWRGYPKTLLTYGMAVCEAWLERGYKDTLLDRFTYEWDSHSNDNPKWLGEEPFHSSHRAALLFKDPKHYSTFGWSEQPKLDYVWPV